MEAWHGSYKLFSKLSTDFFGTGEGGKEAGWGLYFSNYQPGGEYYGEYLKLRYGKGYLYHVYLKYCEEEIIHIDVPDNEQNKVAVSIARSVFSNYTDEKLLRIAYTEMKIAIGEEEVSRKLRNAGIKLIHSSHQKNARHGTTYIAIDDSIVDIIRKFYLTPKGWKEI